ncbi:hypothetical protein QJQ45_005105 [Haematococcus lacustris]|nr:hypothetical protein QJQ45_005105 [Haematococcus lacustris]
MARGNGTSMISLIMPPKDQVPNNGLVVYTGTIMTDDGKEKRVNIDFEPFKPINTSLYLCDNKFHTEALNELLESDNKYGFIIMDGNGSLFGTLSGNTRETLHKFQVDLPKKHGRGGQSALRFARLRMEKRHNYVRKVAEMATQFFITNDRPNVAGLIMAGSADFKTELSQSDMFDPRLQAVVLGVVDVSYGALRVTLFYSQNRQSSCLGGDNGFSQAIELSSDMLSNEKKLISKFFEEISQDSGKYVFGVKDTLACLDMGAVETLIVWENLDCDRYEVMNPSTGKIEIKHLTSEQAKDTQHFKDKESGSDLEVQDKQPLLEWLAANYKKFGCALEFVTNKSQEGSQYCRGFGGVGGILRYQVNMAELDEPDELGANSDLWSDEDF